MADLQALREAEALVESAADLENRTGHEIGAMEAARATAQEGLRRIEATGHAAIQHLGEMGSDLREGRRLQQAAAASLDLGAAAADELRLGLAPRMRSTPALASPAHVPARIVVAVGEVAMPDFQTPEPAALRSLPVPSLQADLVTWDLFAKDVPSFLDRFEKSLEPLGETSVERGTTQPAPRRPERMREKEAER